MTQSKDMTQIRDALAYARDEAERADERIKYKQALNALDRIITPPQSPNRAVLDALDKWDNQGEINHEELCLFIECAREHLKRQKGL